MKSTSLEALNKINTTKTKQKHFNEIVKVLNELGEGTAICIMMNSTLTQHQVSRRTSELERLNIIEVCGKKHIEGRKGNFTLYKLIK